MLDRDEFVTASSIMLALLSGTKNEWPRKNRSVATMRCVANCKIVRGFLNESSTRRRTNRDKCRKTTLRGTGLR